MSNAADLAKFANDGLSGAVLQVVEGSLSTESSTTSTSFVDTGLSASITPSSTSSKILVRMDGYAYNNTAGHNNFIMFVRGSTPIGHSGTGTNDSDNTSAFTISHSGTNGRDGSYTVSVLDSPATTSQVTYKVRFRAEVGSDTAFFNSVDNSQVIPKSTITLMEIAG